METGLAIIEKTATETRGVFIDQDTIECARINALVKKRTAQAEAEQREADRNRRKSEKAEARRKAYNIATAKYIAIRGGIIGTVAWGWAVGMIHPIVSIPVGLFCLCTACVRLGEWFGKASVVKKCKN